MAGTRLRRRALLAAPALLALPPARAGAAGAAVLGFDELYSGWGATGLSFSPRVKALAGAAVSMQGFMAPPLKAEADFFVLTREPMSVCPFCSSDAQWPPDIAVAYCRNALQPTAPSRLITVAGRLEVGSWTDPASGFVSQVRLRDSAVLAA